MLDKDEYDFNIKDLHYSKDIIDIITINLDILFQMIKEKKDPFNNKFINEWYKKFLEMNKK